MKIPKIPNQILILLVAIFITYYSLDYLYIQILTGSDTSFKVELLISTLSLALTLFAFTFFIWYIVNLYKQYRQI
jgi:TRAP-type C4-dicarboxylate transport system permease small subunit